ncbi:phosphinothricin acetyltransferase [Halioglobus japonicus]|uniref:N-acetyltransferase n=1 Tax=Halioglobus japonicus TaxID=930805 RepID=A0AAP8MF75_9GAMM|nr:MULTISPECIES: GNAT family N-acetyltransferase [Halioglobus]AQA18711.1 phosphinothricin acetyltransferase [Halioglobus japonicus]KZX60161.1 phosphinothricin acetyltransferase [Halioglobus sp. HI00S01]PLW86738.1 N-acetyltransferase [Halioglobus japonicus]GHD11314.1 N-acetyltransferase [Halioglobus japonicus]
MIRDVSHADAAALAAIYNHYIENTVATFEEDALTEAAFVQRIDAVLDAGFPWLVLEEGGELLGYAYAARFKERVAYRYSVESTVYLKPGVTGGGRGTALYEALFARLQPLGIHAVIGGITLPNPASVALHEKLGMEQVAHFPEVGFKQGKWLDVGYWQLNFEST